LLHERGHLLCLANVCRIARQSPSFDGQPCAAAIAIGSLRNRLTRRLGAGDAAPARDLVERRETVAAEAERERVCGHLPTVARFALHETRSTVHALPRGYLVERR
jgi:hypothetical protein